jgi:hypothetical protein
MTADEIRKEQGSWGQTDTFWLGEIALQLCEIKDLLLSLVKEGSVKYRND